MKGGKTNGGFPMGMGKDMRLAHTPYFKQGVDLAGDRRNKANLVSRRDLPSPVQKCRPCRHTKAPGDDTGGLQIILLISGGL